MTNALNASQLQTKLSLDRLDAIIKDRRRLPELLSGDSRRLDLAFRDELGLWIERQRSRYFTREEITLQCVVALRYADRSRPTVRELWQYLQVLILQDARMMGRRRPMRFPSYSTFRERVSDLPREFVLMARNAADDVRPSVAGLVSRFDAITSLKA